MAEKQISNRETLGIGCMVSLGVLALGLLTLPGSGYFFPCVIFYILAALPLSLVGAVLGKILTKTQMGIWIGALVGVSLGFAWILSHPCSCVIPD